jgi:hypothetical protein
MEQGLKPGGEAGSMARLKPRPDTIRRLSGLDGAIG